jgi:hypothetical protein
MTTTLHDLGLREVFAQIIEFPNLGWVYSNPQKREKYGFMTTKK